MQARVTAVLVSSNGADYLPRTLDAIAAQTRAPDALVVVDCASTDATSALLAAAQPTRFISASSRLSFGTAVQHALGVAPPPTAENEWLWLLAHDTAPEPDALAALLAAVEVNPSVAAAGPKQMEWNDPDYISEFGETVTSLGASVPLVETELDQAQHDRMSDVLAMGAAGLLVRHTVWNQVGGFDPALPTADNGLDFGIRVRLAGHRVMAVPSARVATDGDGFSGPGRSIKGSARRKRQTARRAAQLHRRLVYAPPFAVLFHWLSLVPLAVARSLFQLIRKQPGAIGGEFAAAFKTAFGSKITEARRRLKASRRVGWRAISPLRMPGDEIRRRRSLQREIALTYLRGERDRIQFVGSGGLATVLVVALIGFVIFLPVFGAAAITGGGALPLDATPGSLWAQIGTGFRDLGLGFVGAADPFAALIAVVGSITFWSPSFAIVCLYLVSLPLAALGAWFCAARITDRPALRSVAAVLWVLAPSFLGALDAGMIGPLIAHLLLPWLVLAGLAAPKSWSASAMASILFAAVLAAAPSLWPALLVIWLIATVASRRDVMRLIGVPIPALALFAPLVYDQFQRGTPLALLADPGVPVWRADVPVIDLLIGLPQTGLAGWQSIADQALGLDAGLVLLIVGILALPLGIIALAALFLPGSYRAVVAVVIGILGFATAVGSTQLALATSGAQSVSIWPGSGLSLYWLGLVGAAVIGLSSLPRLSAVPAVVAAAAVGIIALPMGLGVLFGTAQITPGSGRQLPAYVAAEASNTPRVGTLLLTPQADGGLGASVVHGPGPTLSQQSTLASTEADTDQARTELAEIVGNAASVSGDDVAGRLTALGVEFVLLQPASAVPSAGAGGSGSAGGAASGGAAAGSAGSAAEATIARSSNALSSNPQLTFIGSTSAGELWQVVGDGTLATLPAPVPTNNGTPIGVLVLIVQGFIFGVALLLALPAGRLQVQGNRAVSTTAHVGAADSVEEEIAEEKSTSYDDDIAVGEEPEALELEPASAFVPASASASASVSASASAPASASEPASASTPAPASAPADARRGAAVADPAVAGAEVAAASAAGLAAATGARDSFREDTSTGELAAEPVATSTGVYAAQYLDAPVEAAPDPDPLRPAAPLAATKPEAPVEPAMADEHSAPNEPAMVDAAASPVGPTVDTAPVTVIPPTDEGRADAASEDALERGHGAPSSADEDSAAPGDRGPESAGVGSSAPEPQILIEPVEPSRVDPIEPPGVDPLVETVGTPAPPAWPLIPPAQPEPAHPESGQTSARETASKPDAGFEGARPAPEFDDYDPNDETVLSIRDAIERDERNRPTGEEGPTYGR